MKRHVSNFVTSLYVDVIKDRIGFVSLLKANFIVLTALKMKELLNGLILLLFIVDSFNIVSVLLA